VTLTFDLGGPAIVADAYPRAPSMYQV